jgi:hypothetical protein
VCAFERVLKCRVLRRIGEVGTSALLRLEFEFEERDCAFSLWNGSVDGVAW